jgi:O-methyltransferase involved in polyketide biosynthesis
VITDPPADHALVGRFGGKPTADQPERAGQAPEGSPGSLHDDGWALLNMRAGELAALEQDFPSFQIWREIMGDRVRFVARSRSVGAHPHTLITADLAELRAGLTNDRAAMTPQLDPAQPTIARMYSYLLGGNDHLATDRRAAHELLDVFPEVSLLARANRGFVTRAVQHVATAGIGQFIDVGAGLPQSPNVHQTAQEVNPAARVAYVDCDPLVLAHARALIAGGPEVTVVDGDMRTPDTVLADSGLRQIIDLDQPVCVLLASVLNFVTPAEADAAVAGFVSAMAPGSFLIVSAGTSTGTDPDLLAQLERAYAGTAVVSGRTADEIAGYFTGLDLAPPGLVDVWAWRPSPGRLWPAPLSSRLIGAVGRKPPVQSSASSGTPHPPRSAA